MTPLLTAELVLAVVVGAALLSLLYVWLRRRWISGGKPLML